MTDATPARDVTDEVDSAKRQPPKREPAYVAYAVNFDYGGWFLCCDCLHGSIDKAFECAREHPGTQSETIRVYQLGGEPTAVEIEIASALVSLNRVHNCISQLAILAAQNNVEIGAAAYSDSCHCIQNEIRAVESQLAKGKP